MLGRPPRTSAVSGPIRAPWRLAALALWLLRGAFTNVNPRPPHRLSAYCILYSTVHSTYTTSCPRPRMLSWQQVVSLYIRRRWRSLRLATSSSGSRFDDEAKIFFLKKITKTSLSSLAIFCYVFSGRGMMVGNPCRILCRFRKCPSPPPAKFLLPSFHGCL